MSDILTLASEFLERMSNPAYGIRVNEDYALRFAKLLGSERAEEPGEPRDSEKPEELGEFEKMLRGEVERLNDVDALTPHGWLWILGWARAKDLDLDGQLLLDLTEKWSSVFLQVSAIDLATRRADSDWIRRKTPLPLGDFGHPWLSKLMYRATEVPEEDRPRSGEVHTDRAERVLIALLQVGRKITLDAASTLLHHDWLGQRKVVEYFWFQCDGLEEETRDVWIERLQPPPKPPQSPPEGPPQSPPQQPRNPDFF